jgi:hypothetical protein
MGAEESAQVKGTPDKKLGHAIDRRSITQMPSDEISHRRLPTRRGPCGRCSVGEASRRHLKHELDEQKRDKP